MEVASISQAYASSSKNPCLLQVKALLHGHAPSTPSTAMLAGANSFGSPAIENLNPSPQSWGHGAAPQRLLSVVRLPPAIVPTFLPSAQPVKISAAPTTAITEMLMRRPKEEGSLSTAAIPSMKSSLMLQRASSAEETEAASAGSTACVCQESEHPVWL